MASRVKRVKDPDTDLVDRLFDWHQPRTDETEALLTATRTKFKTLANFVLKSAPRTPDRTVALRALHTAGQAVIFAIVANEGHEDGEVEPQE